MNRCAIIVDDVDRRHYYDLLCDTASTYENAVHAHVFMGNHIHLFLTSPQRDVLFLAMRNTGQCYVEKRGQVHLLTCAIGQLPRGATFEDDTGKASSGRS